MLSAYMNAPIDMERLALFTDGDAAEEKELSRLFLQQAEGMIVELEKSTGDAETMAWLSTVHRFKGSASNLGAAGLHQLCERAELTNGQARKQELLGAIKQETQKVAAFFSRPRIVNTGRNFIGTQGEEDSDQEIIL